jgi:hypothetical protein
MLLFLSVAVFAQTEDYTTWSNHQVIILNTSPSGSNVPDNEYKFPVLIRLNTGNFSGFSKVQLQGLDIRFSKTNYSQHLSYQIEQWVDKAGFADSAAIWVRVDTVLGNNATQSIVMHYGKTGVTSQSSGPAVFDTTNGYQAVYHFNEGTSGNANDATINSYAATAIGTPTDTIGIIGRARFFNGSSAAFYAANTASPPSKVCFPDDGFYTVSAWVYSTGFSATTPAIVSKGAGPAQYHLFERYTTATTNAEWSFLEQRSLGDGGQQSRRTPVGLASGQQSQWVHVVGVRNGPNMTLYVNGVNAGTGSDSVVGNGTRDTLANIGIGARLSDGAAPTGSAFWTGMIDEPEISSVVRDSSWVKLSFQNQQVSQTLVSFSNITVPGTAPTLSSPSNGSSNIPVNVNLTWSTVSGATSYVVQVSTSSTFGSIAFSQSGLSIPTTPAGNLSNSATYYWEAAAANAAGNGAWSAVWSFGTIAATAGIPALSTPTNGSPNLPTSLTLTWGSATAAMSYVLEISTSSSFSATFLKDSVSGTSAPVTGLSPGKTYYWQVAAANSGGQGYWSVMYNFSTSATAVLTNTAIAPSKTEFRVKGEAIEYSVASPGAVAITFSDLLGRTVFAINRMQAAGNYTLALKDCVLANGNYIVRFKAPGYERNTVMMLVR